MLVPLTDSTNPYAAMMLTIIQDGRTASAFALAAPEVEARVPHPSTAALLVRPGRRPEPSSRVVRRLGD